MLSDIFLKNEAKRAEGWLLEQAFPLWLTRGVDWEHGGFFDDLDSKGQPNSKIKRLRSVCRQIYVACAAHELKSPLAAPCIEHGLSFLDRFAKSADGGYYSTFDHYGVALSDHIDTYDLSFVLFAFAHVYRQLRLDGARQSALELLGFIQHNLAHSEGGFKEGIPSRQPRRQNPHMHLFEACLEWIPFDETGAFRRQALLLKELFDTRFHLQNAVVEYFDDDWKVLQKNGEIVEPGHVFEWCWLLYRFGCHFEINPSDISGLLQFGRRHGIASNGLLSGEVTLDGRSISNEVRLWPHAEWVRAEVVARRTTPSDKLVEALAALWRFLDHGGPGLWAERYNAISGFDKSPSPATSLYHITGAFLSLMAFSAGTQ
ncbi:AGE family epimerase/isomerase (plasmid) [Rhizobium sp. CB3090]|uniref:AGE family epimerase/isomerase n=1 Tax=Rhizobium sp. CB3090 TaxID=3039156 RepID=UPI0024B0C38E|nr:AGE family epimerase/isomerase [Rhizobium sp. CB3090]WFU12345.1 AGE family epimerase/isomerase [Rhizobium sp. CB3090]